AASLGFAQEYLELPIDEQARAHRAIAQQCVRDAATYAANKEKFNDYFTKYHFPAMTQTAPNKLGEIGKLREELFKVYLLKTSNAELQRELTDLTFTQVGKIVTAQNPPCHPTARYNAILIVGQLDEKYSPDGRTPPKPYAKATNALVKVVSTATTGNQFPPSVILGALVGLERHAQLNNSLTKESIEAMQGSLLKLVTHDKPIQEMDRGSYAWLRYRAASALARLGTVGDRKAIHDALVKLSVTNKSIDDRCAAVALLDKLDYKDIKLEGSDSVEPLFALARDVAAAEDKRADDFQKKILGGGISTFPAASFPGGMGPGSGSESTFDPNAFQRRITLSRLTDLRTALSKVKPALAADPQAKVDALLAAINPVITITADKKGSVDPNIAESIRTMALAINKAVPSATPGDAAKEAEAAPF
ncbi:MAG: hypothetical protein IT425_02580, partial [Pirellulales bacterium]|nr:hypothetical protein [Pirellulales bacterium]